MHRNRENSERMAGSYSLLMTSETARALQRRLAGEPAFREMSRPYALFCYEGMEASVTYYEKRGRLVLQGRGAEDLINVLGLSEQEQTKPQKKTSPHAYPEESLPHIGVDESGKGDYFGPLVVAGVYADESGMKKLAELGCRDSKQIHSDEQVARIAAAVEGVSGIEIELLCIGPQRYNDLYERIGNLNRLLAWGHARVISALHARVPSCSQALSDQFASNEMVLSRALAATGVSIHLHQRPRAEEDIVVAAASIIARSHFVGWMRRAARAAQCEFPLGCAPHVLSAARVFVQKHGRDRLRDVAKLHFKLTAQL